MGYGEDRVHLTSGMIIRPDFYTGSRSIGARSSRKLGLDPDRPTGLVMFGGHGSRAMHGIARRLDDTQLIMICGHNAALAQQLCAHQRAGARAARRAGIHFADPPLHAARRFLHRQAGPRQHQRGRAAGAAGGGGAQHLDHAAGALQHRLGARERRRHRARIVQASSRGGACRSSRRLDEFRASLARISNRAVFEIPEILERIMESRALPARYRGSAPAPQRSPLPAWRASSMATFLLAFGALFSIVNPLSGAFIFFGATQGMEPEDARRTCRAGWRSTHSASWPPRSTSALTC